MAGEIHLTAAQRKTLLGKAKDLIEDAERECARAKRAGIPCDEAEAAVAEAKMLRDGILREYGTGS